jgi:cysteine desulfurase
MRKNNRLYLDTAAATPLDGQVLRAMEPYLRSNWGNASSIHQEGVTAKLAIEQAREKIAEILGANKQEIIFTSGGTEANNLALLGVTQAVAGRLTGKKKSRLIVSAIEHASVRAVADYLGQQGVAVDVAPVDEKGLVDVKKLAELIGPDTYLVSVMYASNEIGTVQPIKEIAKIIRRARKQSGGPFPLLHCDACQAGRFYDLNVLQLGVDLLTINGSKIYGPKGVGLLYASKTTPLAPVIYGGGQEGGARSGTENVAGIVGLAGALEVCTKLRDEESVRLSKLRDYLIDRLLELIPGVEVNGDRDKRLPNNINLSFSEVSSELLVLELDQKGVACSAGSACSAHTHDESYVIMATGRGRAKAESSIRFTLGRKTKKSDLDYLIKILPPLIEKIRSTPSLD